jgi:hypothetical protein
MREGQVMTATARPDKWLPPGAYRKFRQKQRGRQRGDAMMTAFVERECAAHKATTTESKSD